jgi:hypothetical protein
MILNTPDQIDAFRLISLRGALRLEIMGMKKRGRSAYSIVKEEFKLKGNKQKVFDQLTDILQRNNIIKDR